nr:hypothetical protein GCM10025699_32060 [Microbacterium flavescens]
MEPGAGARLSTYLDSAGDAYDLAVTRFLYDTYETTAGLRDPALLRRMPQLAPLLTRSLASHVDRRFADPRLRQILGYPAVFLGGSPYGVPSLYHLMSHLDLDDGVLYPRGGFIEIIRAIERLAEASGAVIETGARVVSIETTGATATGVVLADGRRIEADLVVSAADLHHTETALVAPELQSYPESWWAKKEPSPGALLLLLGVEGSLPSWRITPCCSPTTGARTSTTSSAHAPASRSPHRCTCAARAPPTRPSRPPGTRTSSCWSRSPPTPRSAAAASPGTATPASRRRPIV